MKKRHENTTVLEIGRQDARIAYLARKFAAAVVDFVREVNTGQQALWESYQRLDNQAISVPDDQYLHWEPSVSGWRIYGDYLPPVT